MKLSGAFRVTAAGPPHHDTIPLRTPSPRRTRPLRVGLRLAPRRQLAPKPMPNVGDLLDLLADWVPDNYARHRVLVDNPVRLYGF